MQSTPDEQEEVIVRGSPEYREYLEHRHGWHIEQVKKLETQLAIWGRPLLLTYVVYTVVKASIIHTLPLDTPAIKYTLLGIDALMLVLQVLGLEGGMPGLIHLMDEMETRGKQKEADTMRFSLRLVTAMLVATGIDIVLQGLTPVTIVLPGISSWALSTGALIATYTNLLLIGRIAAVAYYLTAMARLSHKGPKIISKEEAQKQKEAAEQKQIRIDNANIMAVFQKEIEKWMQNQPTFAGAVQQINEALKQQLEAIEAVQLQRIEAVQRTVEAATIGSTSSPEPVQEVVEPILNQFRAEVLNRFKEELNRSIEAKFSDLDRKVHRLEVAASTQASSQAGNAPTQSGAKAPGTPAAAKITNIAEAREDKGSGISVEAVIELLNKDERLLSLSDAKLGEAVQATKSTAHRAKKRYYELHPEAVQLSDAGEIEAVNQ